MHSVDRGDKDDGNLSQNTYNCSRRLMQSQEINKKTRSNCSATSILLFYHPTFFFSAPVNIFAKSSHPCILIFVKEITHTHSLSHTCKRFRVKKQTRHPDDIMALWTHLLRWMTAVTGMLISMMTGVQWEAAGVVTAPHHAEPKHTDSPGSPQSFNSFHASWFCIPYVRELPKD